MTAGLHHPTSWLRWILANTKRLAVFVLGVAVVGAGAAMLVLPGPGILVIVAGLAILGTEFAWAERMLDRTRTRANRAGAALAATRSGQAAFAVSTVALVAGGGAVAAFADGYRTVGLTALLAGAGALAVLLPAVQRWINRPSAEPPAPAGANDEDLEAPTGRARQAPPGETNHTKGDHR